MKNTKTIKEQVLSKTQESVVKEMIIDGLRNMYIEAGTFPPTGFDTVADSISTKMLKKAQMALLQGAVFEKAINQSEPKKTKVAKKEIKKKTKNARK